MNMTEKNQQLNEKSENDKNQKGYIMRLLKKIKISNILILILSLTFIIFIYNLKLYYQDDYKIYRNNTELRFFGIKDSLVTNINKYIYIVSKGKSGLDGLTLLDYSDKYNIDIKFILAQGHHESVFGTAGIASKTHSVFNVYSYDGRSYKDIISKGDAYSNPNKSIEPYLNLLRNNYLVNGKNEYDMFTKFVDKNGSRYATNVNYEKCIYNIYKNIDSIVPITDIYEEYIKYKTICNK